MNSKQFAFALDRLQPGDWERFEQFASKFLVFDYPSLRSVAAPSGDEGRDSELFSSEEAWRDACGRARIYSMVADF